MSIRIFSATFSLSLLMVAAVWAEQGASSLANADSATAVVQTESDWPMARYDSSRSASTVHELSPPLHLQWVRQLPPPRRAWAGQQDDFEKLDYDASYQPVVVGDMMFVGSMTTDSVTAYDVKTGETRWQYWTDGPVRLAPLFWQGRVYAGSDDGWMHCLDAASGERLWKFQAAPNNRMVLGNRRLISMWPLRGGPVIADGTLYFAAGVWPNEGVFLYALDAQTAEVRWVNSGSSSDLILDSKSYYSFGGLAPQGQLVVAGDQLIVPGGRTVPAVFNRHTGDLLYFNVSGKSTGKAAGGHQVFSHGDWFFNSRDRYVTDMYHQRDGAQYGSVHVDLVSDEAFFGVDPAGGHVHAYAAEVKPTEPESPASVTYDRRGRPIPAAPRDVINRSSGVEGRLKSGAISESYDLQTLWTAEVPGIERLHVKAGSILYGSGVNGQIFALQQSEDASAPQVLWKTQIEGQVFTMLVAQQRLLVVSRLGAVHCFGRESCDPVTHPFETRSLQSRDDRWANHAASVLQQTDVRGGFGLVFGAGSGSLLDELLIQSNLQLSVFEPDSERVAELRQRYSDAGLYGLRVSVHQGDAESHRLPPYIASLIASEVPESIGEIETASFAKALFHPLRPYGGIMTLVLDDTQQDTFVAAVEQAKLEQVEINRAEGAVLLKRPGALPGAGSWTHQYADAGNSAYSADELVKAPLGIAWFGSEPNHHTLPRHMHGPIPHVVQGRLILLGPNQVSARCVYTGMELWMTDLPRVGENFTSWEHEEEMALGDRTVYFPNNPGANFIGAPVVSTADSVYVLHEDRCLRLDAATGQRISEFELPSAEQLRQQLRDPQSPDRRQSYGSRLQQGPPRRWGHIRCEGDHLIVAAYPHLFDDQQPGRVENWNGTSSEFLVVMDRHEGTIRWVHQARYGFRHNAIAAGSNKLFAIDHLSDEIRQTLKRRGIEPAVEPAILGWDLPSGKLLWSFDEEVFGTSLSYSAAHDVLAQSGHPGRRAALPDEPQDRLVALRGETGEMLWSDAVTQRLAPLGMHDALQQIVGSSGEGAVNLLTGLPLTQRNPLTGKEVPWTWVGAIRCGTQNFSRHLALFRSGAAAFAELEGWPTTANLPGVRPGCTNSLVVADGVLNVPDYTRTCSCSYQHQTSLGLVHMPEAEMWTYSALPRPENEKIQRIGINFGAPASRLNRDNDTFWLEYPAQVLPAPEVPLTVETDDDAVWFHQHSTSLKDEADGHRWVAASGVEGIRSLRLGGLAASAVGDEPSRYRVRLHFAERLDIGPGQRVFSVLVQGKTALVNFDVAEKAGGSNRVVVEELETSSDAEGAIEIALQASESSTAKPILCGVEIIQAK